MARSTKTSPAEDLIELAARLPWWLGVALALVSYVGLHHVATLPMPMPVRPDQVPTLMFGSVLRAFALVGQYALPSAFVAGAVMSWVARSRRQQLASNVVEGKAADIVDGMSWQQFEQLVGESFRQQGYAVSETGSGGADGGVDLVLRKGTEKFLVQCKQWRAYKVGVDVVRELYGVMAARGAAGGFVVTSGRFTEEATQFASGRNVQLVDGPKLLEMLKRAGARQRPSAPPGATSAPSSTAQARRESPPSCTQCGEPMTRRLARRGAQAGKEFWGCVRYPACKGTREV